ncbi:hypothetical protein EV702DRAFT_1202312 [Suillus placidus]|uniref:Glycoside hydrolase family 31 N-terminal domain-containing protein n=1 Tax=Suillus placidus TaxID=48579 RepID=A0A9P6ZLF4_9AGAM|nr:hypothetical protein EV702DRAFT_1202312 [Suillus placidus]
MAWADLMISYPADSFVADVDLECLTTLEARMFEDSEEAGPAGNQQWGLDAGQHHRRWNVYLNIPNEWVLARDYSESELERGPSFSDNSDATSSDELAELVAPSLPDEEEIVPLKRRASLPTEEYLLLLTRLSTASQLDTFGTKKMRSPGTLLLLLLLQTALAFKPSDFKTCSQSGFCRRGRALAARAQESPSSWHSPYSTTPEFFFSPHQPGFTTSVHSSIHPNVKFVLDVIIHEEGIWALIGEPKLSNDVLWTIDGGKAKAVYGPKKDMKLVVDFNPLKITLFRHDSKPVEHIEGEGQSVLQVNPAAAWFEGDAQDAFWDETFSTWTDTKPKGPESLSLDITFPNHAHVYGIPQHATNLSLPSTTGPNARHTDHFRLYNADVFEYLSDSLTSLYGSIPLMHAHSVTSTVAVFNALASETWIDIAHVEKGGVEMHWISESGILDVFLLPGPTPTDVFVPSCSILFPNSIWNPWLRSSPVFASQILIPCSSYPPVAIIVVLGE